MTLSSSRDARVTLLFAMMLGVWTVPAIAQDTTPKQPAAPVAITSETPKSSTLSPTPTPTDPVDPLAPPDPVQGTDREPMLPAPEVIPEAPALNPLLRRAMNLMSEDRMMGHVRALCDPALAGRQAGGPGARMAAHYIAERFRKSGLRPGGQTGTFDQVFKIRIGRQISSALTLTNAAGASKDPGDPAAAPETPFKRGDDYMPVHLPNDATDLTAPLAILGYGIRSDALRFDDYASVDVRGKAVLVFAGTPWSEQTAAWVRRVDPRPFSTPSYKAQVAAERGAVALFVVDDPAGWRKWLDVDEQLRIPDRDAPVDSRIPVVHVTRHAATRLTGISEKELRLFAHDIADERRPRSRLLPDRVLRYRATIAGQARVGRNVVGVLVGADPDLRHEAIVIGAHYDHLGERTDGIYFGANDNASGVAAMLEIAEGLASLPPGLRPRRTIIFIAFAAEEIGKLGSTYYVNNPTVAIDRTVMMVNFDMIGRNEPNHVYAVASRSSRQIHIAHQMMNQHVGLRLDHPISYRLGRSDHSPFLRVKVPTLYLFGGLHEGYHSPNDKIEHLQPTKMRKIAQLAMLTAWAVANDTARPSFDGFQRP